MVTPDMEEVWPAAIRFLYGQVRAHVKGWNAGLRQRLWIFWNVTGFYRGDERSFFHNINDLLILRTFYRDIFEEKREIYVLTSRKLFYRIYRHVYIRNVRVRL